MKPLLFVFVLVAMGSLHAQDTVSHEEWKRQNNESWRLTLLLFPDLQKSDSDLTKCFLASQPNPTLYPRLARDSFLPLFTASQVAQNLHIQPQWNALKDSEKLEVVQQLTYISGLLIRVIAEENRVIASSQAPPHTILPGGYIPEASDNIAVREQYLSGQTQSDSEPAPTQGNGAPPPAVPLPPLTTTETDAETGATTVTVH